MCIRDRFIDCQDANQYYFDLNVIELPPSPSYSIKNANTGEIYYTDISTVGEYRIGPLPNQQESIIVIENDLYAICNTTLSVYGNAPSDVSNYQPCSAIDIGSSIGGVYNFTGGALHNVEHDCVAQVPEGGCGAFGYWQGHTNSNGSEWFQWTQSTDGGLAMTFNNLNFGFQIAVWETTDCNELLGGAPILINAIEPCLSLIHI